MEQKKWEFKPNDAYPNTGVLYTSTIRKSEKSPDIYGAIGVDRAYLKNLLDTTSDMQIVLKLSAWKRESVNGNKFLSLQVDTYTGGSSSAAKPVKKEEDDPWA